MPREEFLATPKLLWNGIGEVSCQVRACERLAKTSTQPLCNAHWSQRKAWGMEWSCRSTSQTLV